MAMVDGLGQVFLAIFSVNNILNGFNVYEEGLVVGTAGSIHTLDFRGINVTASAAPQPNGIATVTFSTRPSFDETYITGLSTAGRLIVSGISTFNGEIDANGRIVAAATNNVIPFLYSNLGDLPSLYHSMVHLLTFTELVRHTMHTQQTGMS